MINGHHVLSVAEVETETELARIEQYLSKWETDWLVNLRTAYQAESHSSMTPETWRAFAKARTELIDRVLAARMRSRRTRGVH